MTSTTFYFEPTAFQAGLIDLLDTVAPPACHHARNAVWHLNRAWRIRDLDPEMAAFRGITADEEAAAALFKCLKRRHYRGARDLNPTSHSHKNAVMPFLDAIDRLVSPAMAANPDVSAVGLTIDTAPPSRRVRIQLSLTAHPDELAFPEPPLSFSFSSPEAPLSALADLTRYATEHGFPSLRAFLKARAEQREPLLYAVDVGVSRLGSPVLPVLEAFRYSVFRSITALLLIDPYSEQSPFVQALLDDFLQVLKEAGRRISFVPKEP